MGPCGARKIFSFGSPEQPMKIFALTVQVGPVLGALDTRPPGAPVSHAWAYQDFPNDALAVLLFVRHARRLWTCTDPNVDSRQGPHCALLDRAAWAECPPSRGDACRTRVREGVATYHFTTRRSRADKLPGV
ncbi:hypothetical protein CRG98_033344 [Punica granatum]|uniref:Uncharacterized protein n=1 Tax=Punica granatum TaxID=22663 RepID=A0A2I0IRC1_PUNGR|nr:hypothetical protein CRG98_033344 [Punica granatum]